MHPEQDRLVRLLQGAVPEDEAIDDIGHVATCDKCAERLAALRVVLEDFDGAWGSLVEWLADPALCATPSEAPEASSVEDRTFAFALRVYLDGKQRIAAAATGLLDSLCPAHTGGSLSLNMAYSGIGDADQAPEANRHRIDAAEMLAKGDVPAARKALRAAAGISPDAASIGDVLGQSSLGVPIEVIVDASRPAIQVIARVAGCSAALRNAVRKTGGAVLMHQDGTPLRREPFRCVEGADYLLAEFLDVEDGSWIVGVELDGGENRAHPDP